MSSRRPEPQLEPNPRWYKDAVIYEVHVRAFHDSNADGIGDFRGLTEKLDYLLQLGVTAIWLLPFYPSPLRDDGYDIADYTGVHPAYGTLQDVKVFLREAHRRGLRVITELVLNHTSDQHPWFQRARRARPGSAYRDFYVWSDDPQRYREARVIFKDFEASNWTWDDVAGAYYWHRFFSHQPDLNYDSPLVRRTIMKIVDFWLDLGVDGLRLDAVPYLFEHEGTPGENLPSTHEFLRDLRRHIDSRYTDRMILAEANQWPDDAVLYFGAGDECHMAFHFPLMPRLFMAVRQEDRFPIIDILDQTPGIDESAQWALFLRNHDELTLEMVTDEEREYMYRVYAQHPEAHINLGIRRRLAPLLGNNRRLIELMNGLLCSMPGTPVLYYGDEIGMGDNVYLGDRNGVRTPMQWSADRNAGFSQGNPQQLYAPLIVDPEYHHTTTNVEAQQHNPSSLLNWTARLIALRKRYKAFGRGSLQFLHPRNRKVLAFLRHYENERVLVVANLSRFTQFVELDLHMYDGIAPIEMFGRTKFPRIGTLPYLLTLSPHAFYWFSLDDATRYGAPETASATIPSIAIDGPPSELLTGPATQLLAEPMPRYLKMQRWYGGKAYTVLSVTIDDVIPVDGHTSPNYFALATVTYADADPETYLVPLALASGNRTADVAASMPERVLASIETTEQFEPLVLYDALLEPEFGNALLTTIMRRRKLTGHLGAVYGTPSRELRRSDEYDAGADAPRLVQSEQSNSSLVFGERWVLKLFRRLEQGRNPERELGEHLTAQGFTHSPAVEGVLEYWQGHHFDIGILHRFVPNQGTAWELIQAELQQFFAHAVELQLPDQLPNLKTAALMADVEPESACAAARIAREACADAAKIGRSTAELHASLARSDKNPAFAPEPLTPFYQRSLYQSMRGMTGLVLRSLRDASPQLPGELQRAIGDVLRRQDQLRQRFWVVRTETLSGVRIRVHGNYHLGQLLASGDDWTIIDFEGEPHRRLYERELKRPALLDVATMLQSWHAAVVTAEQRFLREHSGQHVQHDVIGRWGRHWLFLVGRSFLRSYLETAATVGDFLPPTPEQIAILLDVLRLERTVSELGYELATRPHRVGVPLTTLRELLDAQ